MTPPEETQPFLSTDLLQNALAALGVTVPAEEADSRPHLLGALLGMAEMAYRNDLDRVDAQQAHEGYLSAIIAAAGRDASTVGHAWTVLMLDRLNRTAVELHEATEGDGRPIIDAAGPAMLAAANLLNFLNNPYLTADGAHKVLEGTDRNLKLARRNLGILREDLKRRGLPMP